jgi:hypothetical protein
MERNDEKEPCSTNLLNEKISDQNKDFKNIQEVKTVKQKEKQNVYVDDEEDDVDVDDENQIMPANMCLLVENTLCDKKEAEWVIDEDSDHSIDEDLDASSFKTYKEDKKIKSKMPETDTQKIKNPTFGSKINEQTSKDKSYLSSPQMLKQLQHLTNSTLNELYRPSCSTSLSSPSCSTNIPRQSCSTNVPGPSFSTNIPSPSCSTSLPDPSCSTSIPGPSFSTNIPSPSCSTSLRDPSCSTSLLGPSSSTSIPGPSCSTNLSDSSYVFPPDQLPSLFYGGDSNDTNLSMDRELQSHLLSSLYNKLFLDDLNEQKSTELQDINISNLEDCEYSKHYLSENTNFGNTDEEPETENTECFVEDPDIVNPDIMYNIDLNEYYNQLDLLALKVIKTPDDPTGLVEYKQLPPIPQIEQTRKKFTANERFRFANGISEWEYQIDRDDWNKIMVKRAVVFTAHAGFSIANEESLYVLADVAIDYVKKLAVIMKKHFDIQADSPSPNNIDPIDNSLQEASIVFI